jgi:putative phage-type endonuclease
MTTFTYINELENLNNIINILEPDNEPSIFTEENTLDLFESILQLMDCYIKENPTAITEEDFQEDFLDDIKEIFYAQFEDHFWCFDYMEDELDNLIEIASDIFFITFYNGRTNLNNCNENKEDGSNLEHTDKYKDIIKQTLDFLRSMPQPTQRTLEWYIFRHNLITASNAYKAFESQSMVNQLIYEKCQPIRALENDKTIMVNTNTTLHWGQKYEPLSVIIYEDMYKTTVEDFGCIQHETYKFLGASPDGINADPNSERYGRMLEIKNIVNREITGIPKKEYWIQTQLQMEVCGLNECDFLETKFTEYPNRQSFQDDTKYEGNTNHYVNILDDSFINYTISKSGNKKGIIVYFHTPEGKPLYIYKPLDIIYANDINDWEEKTILKYEGPGFNYTFMSFIYWQLEKLSCVLILRNEKWFKDNIQQIEKVWKIIEEERISGYEHRAPNKKQKKEPLKPFINENNNSNSGCLLLGKILVKKLDGTAENIMKVRTESMDEAKNKQ